jgi:hypothetical protein
MILDQLDAEKALNAGANQEVRQDIQELFRGIELGILGIKGGMQGIAEQVNAVEGKIMGIVTDVATANSRIIAVEEKNSSIQEAVESLGEQVRAAIATMQAAPAPASPTTPPLGSRSRLEAHSDEQDLSPEEASMNAREGQVQDERS